MAEKMKALRDRFEDLSRQANALVAEKGDSVWTNEEQSKFDGFVAEMNAIKAQQKSIEELRKADADAFFNNIQKPQNKNDKIVAVGDYFRFGRIDNAALSKGTNTAGGYTVPEELAKRIIDQMKAYGGVRSVAQILSTDSGAKMSFPTSNGTAEVGAIVAENGAAGEMEPTFGIIDLNVYKYTSKYIAVSWELLQDSAVDIVGFVTNRLSERIARAQNAHFTTGTGTSQPQGIVTGATAATAVTAVDYDALNALVHTVDPAYRTGAKFMMSDAALATIETLKDTTGRPLWLPSMVNGDPGTIFGIPVVINNDMDTTNPVIYGKLDSYVVRDVRGSVEARRFEDSAFALNGQVAFCQWIRSGGVMLEPAAVAKMVVTGD